VTTTGRSSNPSTNTAAEVAGEEPTGSTIATGYEGALGVQLAAYLRRVRGGEMGVLPALAGLIVLGGLFGVLSPYFLTRINIANLMTQTAALMMLAIALTFVILLAEIDLSAGVTAGVGMAVFILLSVRGQWAWQPALGVALVTGVVIGLFIGYCVARIGIPSFVVTLGLFLGFQGVQLALLGDGGSFRVQDPAVIAIMNSSMPVWAGWAMLALIVLISAATGLYDRMRRTRVGMPVRPISMLAIRVAVWAVGGGLVVLLLSQNRSAGVIPIEGVPIVVPIALAIVWVGTLMLDRTRFGLHLYAVGGNPEAARRAGINVARVRITAFILCSTLSVVAGLFFASQTGTVESTLGSTQVLPGVAAAVVGGVSLFGGRGRLVHPVIGALLIAMITNGLGLLGQSAGITFIVQGGVLILAASVDALSRRRTGASLARV
jgi:D-xylose transport system permease protein